MREKLVLPLTVGAAVLGLASSAGASPVNLWDFKAYGGFAQQHFGDFPDPGYATLLTPLPPRDHEDMGAFYWGVSPMPGPSLLGINQKKPLVHGQSWKAPGQYYGEKNPIQPGTNSIHGEVIGQIQTGDATGEVIGWATHYNRWIPKEFKDARVAVNYHLVLSDPGSGKVAWDSEEMFFFIDVFETNNQLECCPDGNYNKIPPNQNGCADRFRVGVLDDYNGDGEINAEDLDPAITPEPGASFDARVGSFEYMGVEYNVYLTGFWEEGPDGPILTGEGWSPEEEHIHFEVRAEIWEADAAGDREPKVSSDSRFASCTFQ